MWWIYCLFELIEFVCFCFFFSDFKRLVVDGEGLDIDWRVLIVFVKREFVVVFLVWVILIFVNDCKEIVSFCCEGFWFYCKSLFVCVCVWLICVLMIFIVLLSCLFFIRCLVRRILDFLRLSNVLVFNGFNVICWLEYLIFFCRYDRFFEKCLLI